MLCYSVVIDAVELIMKKCLIRHIEITKFFYVLVNVSPKMGLCSFINEIVLMHVVCYFGPYPYCWDGW